MLTDKVRVKLALLILNYVQGNRQEAAKAVKRLTKLELVQLLCNREFVDDGHFTGNPGARYDFESWVERVISGWEQ